jgi:hypothetical protein
MIFISILHYFNQKEIHKRQWKSNLFVIKILAGNIPFKPMKDKLYILSIAMLLLASCSKKTEQTESKISNAKTDSETVANDFIKYTILKGQQYCDKSIFVPVHVSTFSFQVKFDSSAIYQTSDPHNQSDINKLLGFSDNNTDHHEYSARIGWRWSDNALHLFGYVYNKGIVSFKEISKIDIGVPVSCCIKVSGNEYIFTVNKTQIKMPRESTTALAEGYKLWPYFGGNETAPHNISIWIEEDHN